MSKRKQPDYDLLYSKEESYRRQNKFHHPDYFLEGSPFRVEVRNGDITRAIKNFRNLTKKSGLKRMVTEKSYFKKPSEIRKENKKAARSRQKRQDRHNRMESNNKTNSGGIWT